MPEVSDRHVPHHRSLRKMSSSGSVGARAAPERTRRPEAFFTGEASVFFELRRRGPAATRLLGDAAIFFLAEPVQRLLVDDAAVEHVDLAIRILGVARVVRDD